MQTQRINLQELEQNKGQIPGLPANPRQWTRDEIDRIAKSLKETPELFEARPIIVIPHEGKYVILGGNLRYEGCKKNKAKDAPCFVMPADTPTEKLMEIVIKDNGSFGAWDYDALANEWDDLPLADWGVPDWDAQEIGGGQPEVQEDDFNPDDGVLVRCNPGDIWQLGDHRLMCGDSIDLEQVKKLTGGAKIDMALTDPPYGINVVSKDGSVGAKNLCDVGHYSPVIGDETTETAEKSYNIMKTLTDRIIIFGGNYFTQFLPFSDGWIIWDKRGDSGIRNNFADGEMAWCSFHTPVRIFTQLWAGMIKSGEKGKRLHPTQKPVKMLGEILSEFSKEFGNILDLFGGSGSTMMACEQLNRRCYMMELDPHYCDVIIARWEKLTGKQAMKIN